jgi:hypothetical protein
MVVTLYAANIHGSRATNSKQRQVLLPGDCFVRRLIALHDELDALSNDGVVFVVEEKQEHVCAAPAGTLTRTIGR